MDDRILLIRTGGTIDSEPYDIKGDGNDFVKTLKGDQSLIMRTVAKLPNHEKVDGFSWVARQEDRFVKDSREFNNNDIAALAHIIKDNPRKYFVITHGTDDMVRNARELQKQLKGTNKVVVFTGSIVPLSMQDTYESDAVGALQFTLERIRHQRPGVTIVGYDPQLHRPAFFDPQTVEKDRDESKANLQFTLKGR